MRRILALLLLPLLMAAPALAQDDLLAKVMKAHGQIKAAEIASHIEVVGDVGFKGTQDTRLWLSLPKLLAWRKDIKMPDQSVTLLVVADGERISVFDSTENGVMSREFTGDVLSLARPENGLSLGLESLILELMLGGREFFLNNKTLRIPQPEPDAKGECMFELVSPDGKVDQFFVDGQTFLLKRMVGTDQGKQMAVANVTYTLAKPAPGVFKFAPPAVAKPPQKGP